MADYTLDRVLQMVNREEVAPVFLRCARSGSRTVLDRNVSHYDGGK